MTEQEIKEGIALLCNTSIEVQSYYQNDSNVVNALNAISDQNLKKLNEIYGSSTGVILSIRKELIQRLVSEKSLTVEEFQAIIQRHQSENKRGFRAYPTAFSIVFPLITIGHQEMDAFVKRFIF